MSDDVSKSWFVTFNNPAEHDFPGEPHEVVEKLIGMWTDGNPSRSCAMTYCVSAEGMHHIHMVLEDVKAMRFTALKKFLPSAHLQATKGTKDQAINYIKKKGKFAEKGEVVLYEQQYGEIKGSQGNRRDLEIIEELIQQGLTPSYIMGMSLSYRRYEKLIKDAYYAKRHSETPFLRKIKVIWHVGESGSGKSYVANQIAEQQGEDSFYFVSDYDNGGFDRYNGEPILFMDEFRGQIKYSTLLSMLQGYKTQLHSRYTNCVCLWNEVHITSVLPPEMVYKNMVEDNRNLDTLKQLLRRIDTIVFHYKDEKGYHEYPFSQENYVDYLDLKRRALGDKDGFLKVSKEEQEELSFLN